MQLRSGVKMSLRGGLHAFESHLGFGVTAEYFEQDFSGSIDM